MAQDWNGVSSVPVISRCAELSALLEDDATPPPVRSPALSRSCIASGFTGDPTISPLGSPWQRRSRSSTAIELLRFMLKEEPRSSTSRTLSTATRYIQPAEPRSRLQLGVQLSVGGPSWHDPRVGSRRNGALTVIRGIGTVGPRATSP
jgi:hypothetical protein